MDHGFVFVHEFNTGESSFAQFTQHHSVQLQLVVMETVRARERWLRWTPAAGEILLQVFGAHMSPEVRSLSITAVTDAAVIVQMSVGVLVHQELHGRLEIHSAVFTRANPNALFTITRRRLHHMSTLRLKYTQEQKIP